jgi:hypothetical protein
MDDHSPMKASADRLLPLLVGAVAFVLIAGIDILVPTHVDWLMLDRDTHNLEPATSVATINRWQAGANRA